VTCADRDVDLERADVERDDARRLIYVHDQQRAQFVRAARDRSDVDERAGLKIRV
jgi:hypothetical protein